MTRRPGSASFPISRALGGNSLWEDMCRSDREIEFPADIQVLQDLV
jgi:hypothetical protein